MTLNCDECPANSQECPFAKSCGETIFDWLYEHGDEEVENAEDKSRNREECKNAENKS